MRVLITGSSGQLGREIARQLAPDHEVIGLDRVAGPRTTVLGSVVDRALVHRLVAQVDAVIHVAALHAPPVGGRDPAAFAATNVDGTRHLLEAAAERGHRRFVYSSTTSVYGDAIVAADRAVWVTEALAPRPRDLYEVTKLAAEELCRQAAAAGLPTLCLRVARVVPEDAELVAAYRLYRGLDPRDAAAAHLLALHDRGPGFEALNISGPPPFSPDEVGELARDAPAVIARHLPGAAAAFAARGWRLPARIDRVYAIDRARARLGYSPRHGLASLLAAPDRWIYHLVTPADDQGDPYVPASLALDGYIHGSYQPAVRESARAYFADAADLRVLQIDPRRLGVAVDEAATPRGPMPHLYGPLRRAAVVATLPLGAIANAPDAIR